MIPSLFYILRQHSLSRLLFFGCGNLHLRAQGQQPYGRDHLKVKVKARERERDATASRLRDMYKFQG